jgi:hypothetical protein
MRFSKSYLIIFGLLFAAFVVVFNTFPRSTFSELEKRELAKFPELTTEKLTNGSFTSEVSSWFSDSEPFRDHFMWLSMQVKDHIRLNTGEENVTFHAAEASPESTETMPDPELVEETIAPEAPAQPYNYENHVTADENAKIANAGIIIVGSDDKVRALMAYGGSAKGGTGYAKAANLYKDTFPSVNVYCMVIPTAVEFYCPEKVKSRTRPQRPTIENVFRHLSPDVKPVDIYETLGEHADEDIFLRTDHHWAPLGAFYAAQKFAEVAGVPFHPLSDYDRKVVHRFVGNMYGYSQDIAVKNAPEDFVYYVPRDVTYSTTYIDYTIDENYRVIGMGRPHKGIFFHHFKDGSGAAYCTFMGSDTRITHVKTSTHNGRRVLILKDSFGNALPGYLFYSFEEVHVIDSRYFTKNMVEYVKENQITDILFANNIFKAYSSGTYAKYIRYLKQTNGLQKPIIKQMADSTLQKATIQDSATAVQAVKPAMPKIKKDSVAN